MVCELNVLCCIFVLLVNFLFCRNGIVNSVLVLWVGIMVFE